MYGRTDVYGELLRSVKIATGLLAALEFVIKESNFGNHARGEGGGSGVRRGRGKGRREEGEIRERRQEEGRNFLGTKI